MRLPTLTLTLFAILSTPALACEETAYRTCLYEGLSYEDAPTTSTSTREWVRGENARARAVEAQERQERAQATSAYLDRVERSYEASRARSEAEDRASRPRRVVLVDQDGRTVWGTVWGY